VNKLEEIRNAAWNGEIDQISTREVAEQFDCSLTVARTALLKIVQGKSGDSRFVIDEERHSGVIVSDGRTFDYSPMDIDGGGISSNGRPKHYIWFLS